MWAVKYRSQIVSVFLWQLLTSPIVTAASDDMGGAEVCLPIWIEQFNAPLNPEIWSVVEGDGCDIGLCGWGNDEQQTYDRDSIVVVDGLLKIRASISEDGRIRSGKITTAGKHGQQFGRIEARMRLPAGRGLWPAFWMMPEPQRESWPLEGEIDILEWTGNEPNRIIGAAHFGDVWPNNVHYSETLLVPSAWSGEFHNYGVIWQPGVISWTVDGRVHGTVDAEVISPHRWVFDDQPFHFIINLAVGGKLGGDIDPEDMPATLEVDWIKVYPATCNMP